MALSPATSILFSEPSRPHALAKEKSQNRQTLQVAEDRMTVQRTSRKTLRLSAEMILLADQSRHRGCICNPLFSTIRLTGFSVAGHSPGRQLCRGNDWGWRHEAGTGAQIPRGRAGDRSSIFRRPFSCRLDRNAGIAAAARAIRSRFSPNTRRPAATGENRDRDRPVGNREAVLAAAGGDDRGPSRRHAAEALGPCRGRS